MDAHTQIIKAGEFKTHCLELMDNVKNEHVEYIITKRGMPVAKLVPLEIEKKSPFGCMRDTILFMGDLISPIDTKWNAEEDEEDFTWYPYFYMDGDWWEKNPKRNSSSNRGSK